MAGSGETISLCVIARDDETGLARCLGSACDGVDEIIVVDTGSVDGTPAVARAYGAHLSRLDWTDDFSAARNRSLRQATCDWILVLDADEELPPGSAGRLRKLAAEAGVEAWTFLISSPVSAGEEAVSSRHANLRMFRNRKAYRFEGRIHEQVQPSILRERPEAVIGQASITIRHYGYMNDTGQRASKNRRNIVLLEAVLAEDPANPFHLFNLGVSHLTMGRPERARECFESALAIAHPGQGFAPALHRNYCLCLCEIGRYDQALEAVDEAISLFPDYPDLYFAKGQALWDIGMIIEAAQCFERSARFVHTPPQYTTTEGVTGYLAQENLAEAHALTRDYPRALVALENALAERPSARLWGRLASLRKQAGEQGDMIAVRLERDSGLGLTQIARILFDAGELEACLSVLGRGTPWADERAPADRLLAARCLLGLGRRAEVGPFVSPLLGDGRGDPQDGGRGAVAADALRLACVAAWTDEPRKDAGAWIEQARSVAPLAAQVCAVVSQAVTGRPSPDLAAMPDAGEAREFALDTAVEALRHGDMDLALAIGGMAITGAAEAGVDPAGMAPATSAPPGEVYFALGRQALRHGLAAQAARLLERSIDRCRDPMDALGMLGLAYAMQGLSSQAFWAYFRASRRRPADERLATRALDQLVRCCRTLALRALDAAQGRSPELRSLAARLAGLGRRALGPAEVTLHDQ